MVHVVVEWPPKLYTNLLEHFWPGHQFSFETPTHFPSACLQHTPLQNHTIAPNHTCSKITSNQIQNGYFFPGIFCKCICKFCGNESGPWKEQEAWVSLHIQEPREDKSWYKILIHNFFRSVVLGSSSVDLVMCEVGISNFEYYVIFVMNFFMFTFYWENKFLIGQTGKLWPIKLSFSQF